MTAPLLSPLALRGVELPNRIVVSPMCQYSAIEGSATDWHLMHLGQFAVSGAGLVIVEATHVEERGRITHGCLGLYSDDNEGRWAACWFSAGGTAVRSWASSCRIQGGKARPAGRGRAAANHCRPPSSPGQP